jgi:virginiamycin B lyase
MKFLTSLAVLVPLAMLVTPDRANDPVEIREWVVPYRMIENGVTEDGLPADPRQRTRPRDPDVHPDGRVFFVGQAGNYIAHLDPGTGEFKRYTLDAGVHPHNLIVDQAGVIWYAGNRASHIGRLDPATGAIRKFMMPESDVRDPHTLVFDKNGDIWFSAQGANVVGKLTMSTGAVRIIRVSTPNARPYGIVMDPSGTRPWIALFGTNKLATVDPSTMELKEIALPRADARPRRLQLTSDGHVWYGDYQGGKLGRYHPTSGKVDEWDLPAGGGARPYAMVVDDRDRLWTFEGPQSMPVRLVGFDPKTAQFFSVTPLESGPGTVRHAVFHRSSRTIWFGTDANTIGRAAVP